MEHMHPRAARQRMKPTDSLDFRSMFALQRTIIGRMKKKTSVKVVKAAGSFALARNDITPFAISTDLVGMP